MDSKPPTSAYWPTSEARSATKLKEPAETLHANTRRARRARFCAAKPAFDGQHSALRACDAGQ